MEMKKLQNVDLDTTKSLLEINERTYKMEDTSNTDDSEGICVCFSAEQHPNHHHRRHYRYYLPHACRYCENKSVNGKWRL